MSATKEQNACGYFLRNTLEVIKHRRFRLNRRRTAAIAAFFDPARIHQKIARGAGSPAHAIVEEAEKGKYDTILVGRRGLSKVEEFMMGRVSNRVIHMAKDKTVWVVC